MRSLIFSGLAACLTLVAGPTIAQTLERVERASQTAPVSRADFVERRLAPLAGMDADRDGTVTSAERQAARSTRMKAMADRRFDRLDADKNGVISREEFAATDARANVARGNGGRMRGVRSEARLRPGRNGPVRQTEVRASRPVVIADVRTRIEAAFDRLDTDRDGTVTAAERQAARTALRERAHSRREAARASRRHAPSSAPSPSTPASA